MDAPLQGAVDVITQADTAIQLKGTVNENKQAAPAGHMHMK
jgi:hypothetical protein